MSSDLIRVTQLPVIEERLRTLKERVDRSVTDAMALVCSVDTLQTVKAVRADLRREFDLLEQQRKEVKNAVLAPYERFEAVYRECVSNAFQRADADLKNKINGVEAEIKGRCEAGLRDYFDELCAVHHLEWLTYERSGIKVDMASAKQKTPKKLREQLAAFVTGVARDVDAISDMEYADEILVEFQSCLDFVQSIKAVSDRHRRIETVQEEKAALEAAKAAEAETVRKVEALAPPTVRTEPETLTVTFTVTDTRERLIALREWLRANHYDYK